MNILDENITDDQRKELGTYRIRVRHIGRDLGRSGMTDEEIIPLLHQLRRPTVFSSDADYYRRRLCHANYCLV